MLEDRDHTTGRGPGPLFLVGAPRSGTTLVYKLLCLHPDTAWISNWVRRFPRAPQLSAMNSMASLLPEMRHRAWFAGDSNAYVYGTRRPLSQRLFPAPVEGEPVFRQAGLGEAEITDPAATPEAVERLREAVGRIERFSGGRYFVNKRVANNRRIPLLAQAFPSARFLEIVRDGRAVAHSLSTVDWWADSTVWWNGKTPRQWEAEGGDPWELCAQSWVEELEATSRGLAMVAPVRVMQVRYEELVAQPAQLLSEIAQFAGLPESREWWRAVSRCDIRPCRASWRTALPEEALATVEGVQSDMLRLHGYSPDPRFDRRPVRQLQVEAPQAL
ncbi:MAG TPA: sulfotransferase [Actinomycetota bacterium]|nr:sulfotransferase [Actinomycetota bacterium]